MKNNFQTLGLLAIVIHLVPYIVGLTILFWKDPDILDAFIQLILSFSN